jgi:hypothetical protein
MSVYNAKRYVAEAVRSILDQSFRNFEFIVIDDGSTDGSGAILHSYQEADPRLRVYTQKNRGLIESLNRGCELARGTYIARMDADDVAVRDRLESQVAFMEQSPDVGVLGGTVEIIDAAGSPLGFGYNLLHDSEIRSALPECPFWHSTILMRTEVFIATGGYRKIVIDSEDHDLWLRMAERAKLANLPQVLLRYRVHPDQVSVRKCKQQALSGLAAQVAFLARKRGEPDPLDQVQEITPALLVGLGVSEAQQDTAFARKYLWRAQRYSRDDHKANALEVLKETDDILCDVRHTAYESVIADLHLLRARLYWRNQRYLKAGATLAQAIGTRPLIVGRPVKMLLRQLRQRCVPRTSSSSRIRTTLVGECDVSQAKT